MTDLVLVRHGETDWNSARRIQGTTDVPLNDTGREQARDAAAGLAAELSAGTPTIVVASDLSRARETAEIIADVLGAPVPRVYPELRERDYGEAEGTLVDDFRDRWGDWHIAQVPGAEPWEHVRARGVRGLRRIARDARAMSAPTAVAVVAVSHGAMIGELIRHASGGTLPLAGERIDNGSRHRFLVERDSISLMSSTAVPV
ncbi:MAG: histidine phosphatase family protein [Microbacterium sp.]|uniref:histidine phosphatase family protein n=1 Tax=Microbacterium sp. TaxID=51671 RepID=UPI0039E37D0D